MVNSAAKKQPSDIFEPLVEEGGHELERSLPDLILSGFIAGLDIGFGALAVAVVAGKLHTLMHLSVQQALFYGSFLYPLGFIFVIAGRSELYTENTVTPLAGVLAGNGTTVKVARRWLIVLATNLAGCILFSLLVSHTSVVFDEYKPIYAAMGLALVKQSFLQAMLAAVFAGWLVALLAWLIAATEGSSVHFLITYVLAYLLVALGLYHCVIGSIEVLLGMFAGAPIDWSRWLQAFLLPAVIGNTIGAVGIVTVLRGVQARGARRE